MVAENIPGNNHLEKQDHKTQNENVNWSNNSRRNVRQEVSRESYAEWGRLDLHSVLPHPLSIDTCLDIEGGVFSHAAPRYTETNIRGSSRF